MKIVAVIGSPKGKGSGHTIVKMIEDRMRAMGDVEFAYLFLKDENLKPCTGCYTCMTKGEDKCPLKDDRAAIEQKLLAADGIILSSPVHVSNVSWLMKNFIDSGRAYYFDTDVSPIKAAAAKALVGIAMYMYTMLGMGPGNLRWPVPKKKE